LEYRDAWRLLVVIGELDVVDAFAYPPRLSIERNQ